MVDLVLRGFRLGMSMTARLWCFLDDLNSLTISVLAFRDALFLPWGAAVCLYVI